MTPRQESPTPLSLPQDILLPLFVYGALRPSMPAFSRLRQHVEVCEPCQVEGELFVRDGMPLLLQGRGKKSLGSLIQWKTGAESLGYKEVCEFEPEAHYTWSTTTTDRGSLANVLIARCPTRGNPQPLEQHEWRLTNDPVFGHGMEAVQAAVRELEEYKDRRNWNWFFRAQMAYLLLWSIVERLSALCIGPTFEPNQRINRLDRLPGMNAIISRVVIRKDVVTDSRDPSDDIKLDPARPERCFRYYYQVRSNITHRGKSVLVDTERIWLSLQELLSIVQGYLAYLRQEERAQ